MGNLSMLIFFNRDVTVPKKIPSGMFYPVKLLIPTTTILFLSGLGIGTNSIFFLRHSKSVPPTTTMDKLTTFIYRLCGLSVSCPRTQQQHPQI